MNRKLLQNLLILVPVIILVKLLMAISMAQDYLEDLAVGFIYDTNVRATQRIAIEVKGMLMEGYDDMEHQELFQFLIQVYNRTIGSEDAIITFLVDKDLNYSFGSEYTHDYMVDVYFGQAENTNTIRGALGGDISGEVELREANGDLNKYFYQNVTDGSKQYYLFIGVDKAQVIARLNVDMVIIPICIIGLLLLFSVEYIIYLKMKTALYDEGGDESGD